MAINFKSAAPYLAGMGTGAPGILEKAAKAVDPSTHKQDKAAREALEKMAAEWDDLPVPELGEVAFDPYAWQGDVAAATMATPEAIAAREVELEPDVEWQDAAVERATRAGDVASRDVAARGARAVDMGPTAFNDVAADPRLRDAQMGALAELAGIADGGGLTLTDQAVLSKIRSEANAADRGRREAVMSNMRSRGMGGSGMELLAQLQNTQATADREAQAGLDQAATAQERALQAILQGGQMSGQMRDQDFGEQARIAQARDVVSQFNAANANDMNRFNAQMGTDADRFNAQNALQSQMFNVGAENDMRRFNAGNANDMARFNTQGRMQTAAGNRDARMQGNQWNAGQANNLAQFNAGRADQAALANMAATNDARQANWQGRQGLANANVDQGNQQKMFNQYERPMSQYEMQTKKLAGKTGTSQAMSDFWSNAGDRKAKQSGQIMSGLFTLGGAGIKAAGGGS